MRRLEIHVGFRNRDVLRKGAVARHSENRRSLGPELSITAPTKHRIDDDLGRAFLMNAGAIGPERTRQRDAGVEPLGDKYVAPVEGRRAYTHERLVRRRHGAIDLVDSQVFGAADLVQSHGFHHRAHCGVIVSETGKILLPSIMQS